MTHDTERRFAAARPEQTRVAQRLLVEFLLSKGPSLLILAYAYRLKTLSDVPTWAFLLVLVWFLAHVYDRTRDVVIRSYGLIDRETAHIFPLDRMTSGPVLESHWLYGPRIGFDLRLTGVIFGKDSRRSWINVGQLPETTRQELLAYLAGAFERRRLGASEDSSTTTPGVSS